MTETGMAVLLGRLVRSGMVEREWKVTHCSVAPLRELREKVGETPSHYTAPLCWLLLLGHYIPLYQWPRRHESHLVLTSPHYDLHTMPNSIQLQARLFLALCPNCVRLYIYIYISLVLVAG